jgi:hypothetical protein
VKNIGLCPFCGDLEGETPKSEPVFRAAHENNARQGARLDPGPMPQK